VKLAVNLSYQGAADLAVRAEQNGFAMALAPEGYKSDAASVLGLVAGHTKRIRLASGVMQIPARPPALTALTAATLDWISGGRFVLGLGVSNPDVSVGWYGVGFENPLGRTREYVDIVRRALTGAPVTYDGEHFKLPAAGGAAAPLQVYTEPIRRPIPVYLAAVGPKNLRLTGEIADGWIGVFTSPDMVAKAVVELESGMDRREHRPDSFDVMPCLPTVIDELDAAADQLRAHYAYMLGIGARATNFYCALGRRLGYAQEIDRVRDRIAVGDRAGAGAAVPRGLIEDTALIGPVEQIADRMLAYSEAGATTLSIMVSAADVVLERRLAIVEAAAEALERSGVGEFE